MKASNMAVICDEFWWCSGDGSKGDATTGGPADDALNGTMSLSFSTAAAVKTVMVPCGRRDKETKRGKRFNGL